MIKKLVFLFEMLFVSNAVKMISTVIQVKTVINYLQSAAITLCLRRIWTNQFFKKALCFFHQMRC